MVRSLCNLFRGINPHLHASWETQGDWTNFHSTHITFLAAALQRHLLPLGYRADVEQSLQLRRSNEKTYPALAIYRVQGIKQTPPVAWLELLSPSNKPPHTDFGRYEDKRLGLLQAGIVFIELDYLHASPPTFERIRTHTPYRIIVIDPRPQLERGRFWHYGFHVDDPIPSVAFPLSGEDVVRFDFNAPYQRTFDEIAYGGLVDYRQLPAAFKRFPLEDQRRIAWRMVSILEADPLHLDALSLESTAADLESGLARLMPLTSSITSDTT